MGRSLEQVTRPTLCRPRIAPGDYDECGALGAEGGHTVQRSAQNFLFSRHQGHEAITTTRPLDNGPMGLGRKRPDIAWGCDVARRDGGCSWVSLASLHHLDASARSCVQQFERHSVRLLLRPAPCLLRPPSSPLGPTHRVRSFPPEPLSDNAIRVLPLTQSDSDQAPSRLVQRPAVAPSSFKLQAPPSSASSPVKTRRH